MGDTQEAIDGQMKDWMTQLPDPASCDTYEYIVCLNKIFKEFSQKYGSLNQIALKSLNTNIILPLDREEIIIPRLLTTINLYRAQENIDATVIQSIIDMYVLLQRLSYSFEDELLKAAIDHFVNDFNHNVTDKSGKEVHSYVVTAIEKEEKLLTTIHIPTEMHQYVIRRLIDTLLKGHPMVEYFAEMINEKMFDELRSLYQLRKISSSLDIIYGLWRLFIDERVRSLFVYGDSDMEDFIRLKNEYNTIVNECFEGDKEISSRELIAMLNNHKVLVEIWTKYIHKQLKKAITYKKSLEEHGLWMNHVTEILPYLDLEVAQNRYLMSLGRRFRKYKTLAIDAEKLMLSKLADFPEKNTLMNDIEENIVLDKKFEEYLNVKQIQLGLVLDVKVTQYAPCVGQQSTLTYPSELQRVMKIYGEFYTTTTKTEHGHRVLHWNYPLRSTCIVTGNFESGTKELVVTLRQAVVLMLFNDYESLSFDEIVDKTGIQEQNLKEILVPILRSGMIVQEDDPDSDNTTFHYGNEFFSPCSEFNFTDSTPSPSTKAQADIKRTQILLESTIVRLLKSQKIISERNLIKEIYARLGARISIKSRNIEETIAQLIDRQFIRRSSDEKMLEYKP